MNKHFQDVDINEIKEKSINKGKRGIKQVIFGRTSIMLLCFLLQLLVLILGLTVLSQYVYVFFGGYLVFGLIILLIILNRTENPSFQLAWASLVLLFPAFGGLLYLYIELQPGTRLLSSRLAEIDRETETLLMQDGEVLRELNEIDPRAAQLANYVRKNGYPLYRNEGVRYFPSGEKKFEELLYQLKQAQKFIFLEYFIVSDGYMWDSILSILKQKVQEGVEVRMMYDGTDEMFNLPHEYRDELNGMGIRCKVFSPVYPIFSTHYNNRDHRKIVVIDGRVAFTGGINLADEYINRKERFGHWKDAAIMVQGDAVKSFTVMFLKMWAVSEKTENMAVYLRSYGGDAAKNSAGEHAAQKKAQAEHNTAEHAAQTQAANTAQSMTQSQSANTAQSMAQSQSANTAQSMAQSQSANIAQSMAQSQSVNTAQSMAQSQEANAAQSTAKSQAANTAQSTAQKTAYAECSAADLQLQNVHQSGDADLANREQKEEVHECSAGFDCSAGYVMPYAESPFAPDRTAQRVYLEILNSATRYVHIMTPYLVPDQELIQAMKYAAKRGVDVKLVLPHIPDKKYAFALAHSYYKRLMKAGVKIYEYTPGFVHSKVFVSDDVRGVVGAINLDFRSLYLHFECAMYLYGMVEINALEDDFRATLPKCQLITEFDVRHDKLSRKIAGQLMRLVAPLM